MKEVVDDRRSVWTSWVFLLVIALVGVAVFFLFFSYDECKDRECFEEALAGCDRVKFVGGEGMVFEYIIKGKSGDFCEVDVVLLQGDLDSADSMNLEGRKMSCMLPEGVVVSPENDIGNCHGLLKEGLQDLVIRKLHSYLVQNLGRLNLEATDLPEVS